MENSTTAANTSLLEQQQLQLQQQQQLPIFTTSAPCQYHRGHALTVSDLSLSHDGGRVLFQAADCSFPHGSITGLVGTNGAGKSSLARVLAAKVLDGFPADVLTVEYLAAADDDDNHNYNHDSTSNSNGDALQMTPRNYIQSRLQARLDQLRQSIQELEQAMEEADPSAAEQQQDPEMLEELANELSDLYEVEESMVERMERETEQAMERIGLQAHLSQQQEKQPKSSSKEASSSSKTATTTTTTLGQLSCGWRYKCRLIAAILTHPDFLIMDEPSFLDHNSTEWLMEQLQRMAKVENTILLLISHKETLLEALCDRILHINSANQTLTTYNCSYDNFRIALESNIQQSTKIIHDTQDHLEIAKKSLKKIQASCKKREHNLQHYRQYVAVDTDKRWIGGKCKEAKQKADRSAASRLRKAQAAVQEAQENYKDKAKRERTRPLQIIGMPADANNGKALIAIENVAFGYDNIHNSSSIDNCLKGRQQQHEEKENDDNNDNDNGNNNDLPLVFENVDTSLDAHDRVLLQGYNGCGKTTLVQLILGHLQPTEGTIHCYTENILYFPQTALQQLIRQHGNRTALEFLLWNSNKNTTATTSATATTTATTTITSESKARQHLGDWGLTKDLPMNRVVTLSAGQRVRLWLAKQLLIHPKPSLLILDEVSENVDVETRESLVELLKTFAGAVLVISHDPDFVERGSFTKIWKLWRYGLEVTFPDDT